MQKFLEQKLDFEASNPLLPESLHTKLEIKPATYIYSFFRPYDCLAYDLVLDIDNLVHKPAESRAFYFDTLAEERTDFASNAYWYVTYNNLGLVFEALQEYDTFASVDFNILGSLAKTFEVFETQKAQEPYISPYINYQQLYLTTNEFVAIGQDMLSLVKSKKITDDERKQMEEVVLYK